jgi:hypothetical protein
MPAPTVEQIEGELAEFIGQFYADPLGFVLAAFPWGEDGPLKDHDGPDTWQREYLTWLGEEIKARRFDGITAVPPIRAGCSSGHGLGKSTIQAWIVVWIMSTRPRCRGTVTANTAVQLDTKTWAAIQYWAKLSLTAHWFEINTQRFYRKGQRESWFCSPQSCREENSEAFAGQHAADSTSFYIFDEASAVPNVIYEVAEGGLTDGEPMIFLFGNPTRSTGEFHRSVFGSQRHRWKTWVLDAREGKFTNKAQIAEWIQDYGEDSDFVRVRVRGLPPRASDLQFIGSDVVFEAQNRPALALQDDPLVAGLDLARGGSDECVIRFRRGADARSIPPIRIPGEQARDSMRLVGVAAEVLGNTYQGRRVKTLFVDATGGSIGGPVADRLRQLGHSNVVDVQFGGESPDREFANMRAFMWGKMRDWLKGSGAIDTSSHLEQDLVGPGYRHDRQDRVVLESKEEMKKRGLDSPDDGDALALTFAMRVAASEPAPQPYVPVSAWS